MHYTMHHHATPIRTYISQAIPILTLCHSNMYAYYVSIGPRHDRQKDQTTLIEPVGEVVWEWGQDTHETYSVLYLY